MQTLVHQTNTFLSVCALQSSQLRLFEAIVFADRLSPIDQSTIEDCSSRIVN